MEQNDDPKQDALADLISGAFAKSGPKKITEVTNEIASSMVFPMSDGSFRNGSYVNTTR